ncbi:hypothetical protein VNI00_007358 [Paramarasmius palmivorus]|uniref:Uncharacterized protein n=1 Tax=Paramarasmius palmivorus TaxID=297713 RepID=A0AAW0D4S5_9AGAR
MSEVVSWSEGQTHFWSLDENGQSEMTEDELEQWGVPKLAPLTPFFRVISWDSSIYTTLYDWQIACGFDPNTADFARHLGYPELEILRPKGVATSGYGDDFTAIDSNSGAEGADASSDSVTGVGYTHHPFNSSQLELTPAMNQVFGKILALGSQSSTLMSLLA